MKTIEVSESGFSYIKDAQSERDRAFTLSEIADSSYNSLYNAISETTDNKYNGCFIFHDKEDGDFSVRYKNKAEEKEGKN